MRVADAKYEPKLQNARAAVKEAERALAVNRVTVVVLPVTQLVAPGGTSRC